MRASVNVLWLIASLLFVPCAISTTDGDVLVKMMSTWQVSRPSNWTGSDPCAGNWEGVQCDSNSRVSQLSLVNKGLVGVIPNEIGSLESLTKLDLSNSNNYSGPWNLITGDLSALSGLSNLQSLNLTFNVLNEDFPTVVLQFSGLTALRIDNCNLSGAFPQGLSKLPKLEYLYLGNNTMSGSLPSELGSLINLIELSLWGNNFSSNIPKEFSSLANLQYMNLHGCSLFGGLPSDFANLNNLQKLYLYNNSFTGPIPDTWKNMKNLQDLKLQSNSLTKLFPSWIQNSTSLISVDISYNELYGTVPNITSPTLEKLNIACNFFYGSDPSSTTTTLTISQNCFQQDYNADYRVFCNSFYNCFQFNKTVVINGACPNCPQSEMLANATTCVCGSGTEISLGSGGSSHSHKTIIGVIVGAVGAVVLVLFGSLLAFRRYKTSWRKRSEFTQTSKYGDKFNANASRSDWEAPKGIQRFSLEEIAKATSGFSSDHEIGMGGFGKVFYGVLENGKEVAIKRASATSMQGSAEFRNEVMLLSRLHHRNLVRLEGFCEDNDLQILVYEYVPNGNLHRHLFNNSNIHSFGWLRRLDIAVGIAQGLDYLHSFADPPVIHRDVKPSNILLDNNLVAKVADFGISKTTMEFETHISTTPAGTAGYIDPQYFLRRHLNTASDVYGFGVVLMELITGQKAIDPGREEDHNLVEWVKVKMKVDGLQSIIDPRIRHDCPLHIFQDVVRLAISCASFEKNDRPQMKEAVTILDQCLRTAFPPLPSAAPLVDHPSEHHATAVQALEEDETNSHGGISFKSTLSASKSAFKGCSLMPR